MLSCECLANTLIFDANAILRQELSWWSTADIPTKTKPIILNTRQREFDIIEWHARALAVELNKKKMPCNMESISLAWAEWLLTQRECTQVRKTYITETAWNPNKGTIKNTNPQEKWDNKISKKLKHYNKLAEKTVLKLKKKLLKKEIKECTSLIVDVNFSPIKRVMIEKENVIVKEDRVKTQKSFKPNFPRANQLE